MQKKSSSLIPTRRRAGTFSTLALTSPMLSLLPYAGQGGDPSKPRRKSMDAPVDNNTFVKPIRQSFVKNPRLMPMTRLMLTLLSGWAGRGDAIKTTIGIIAKHMGRCRRQVFRYLKDAVEEGYLFYSRTKDRIGRYTGVRISLNFPAIRFKTSRKPQKHSKAAENLDVTLKSETNGKSLYTNRKDDEIWKKLISFGETLGYFEKKNRLLSQ